MQKAGHARILLPIVQFEKIWIDQCRATRAIKRRFGVKHALDYLVGEKLRIFAGAARHDAAFARELPRFLAAIWRVFNEYELAGYVAMQKPTVRSQLRARFSTSPDVSESEQSSADPPTGSSWAISAGWHCQRFFRPVPAAYRPKSAAHWPRPVGRLRAVLQRGHQPRPASRVIAMSCSDGCRREKPLRAGRVSAGPDGEVSSPVLNRHRDNFRDNPGDTQATRKSNRVVYLAFSQR